MADTDTLKLRLWNDARADKWDVFNEDYEALLEKAAQDIWRMGWSLAPRDINDVYGLLDDIAKWCHERWLEAMKRGDAPPEDISPAEGFIAIKKIIQDAVDGKGSGE